MPRGVAPINDFFYVVAADVTALLVIYVLDREQLVADTVFNRLYHRKPIKMPDGAELVLTIGYTLNV